VTPEQSRHRGLSFGRRSRRNSSASDTEAVAPKSELEAAAAAALAAENASSNNTVTTTPTKPKPVSSTSSSSSSKLIVTPPPSRTKSTAGGELRSAKQTLIEREHQLNRVSQRSREMSDSAANFAVVAQGFLELSQQKKR